MSKKVKTPDGCRTQISDLNIGAANSEDTDQASGAWAGLKRCYKNLSLVMAGMYTGLNCYGTPNTEHSYENDSDADKHGEEKGKESNKKPDRRPI